MLRRSIIPAAFSLALAVSCAPSTQTAGSPTSPNANGKAAATSDDKTKTASFPEPDDSPWPPPTADTPLIPDKTLIKALLKRRLSMITPDGRPPGDPIADDIFPEMKLKGPDEYVTVSESVAYYMKVIVLAARQNLLEAPEAKKHFDAVFNWAKKSLQGGQVSVVYDVASKRQKPISEYKGTSYDPKAALAQRPGCFAWRYISPLGVPSSTDYSKDSVTAATDAELEITGALLLAGDTFHDSHYVDEARIVARCMSKELIRKLETPTGDLAVLSAGTTFQHMAGPKKPGFTGFNVSYFIMSDLELASRAFDADKEFNGIFASTRKDAWTLLDKTIRTLSPGGLPPNWAQVNARREDQPWVTPLDWQIMKTRIEDKAYGFDALRLPLRLRTARLRGIDMEQQRLFWKTTGKKGAQCLADHYKKSGKIPTVVPPDCGKPIFEESPPGLLAARVWFLETGQADLAEESLKRFLSYVRCTAPSEKAPAGCTEAYFDPIQWDYFPAMLTMIASLEESDTLSAKNPAPPVKKDKDAKPKTASGGTKEVLGSRKGAARAKGSSRP